MISILIPVYNTAKYLRKCLNSVLIQSYTDLEIIIINDGSTDNCINIINEYQTHDHRIKVINKIVNEGLERARKSGLLNATGDFIFHIDSDDWLDNPNVLEILYKCAEETQADYVEIGLQRVVGSHKWFKRQFNSSDPLIISQPQLFTDYFISFFGLNKLSVNMCGKLYRKSTLDRAKIKTFGLTMGEDMAYNLQLFPNLTKIVLLNQPGYNYRVGGMTSRYNSYFLKDMKTLFYIKKSMIKRYNYTKAIPWTIYELKNVLKYEIIQLITFHKKNEIEIINRVKEELNDPIYENFNLIEPTDKFWKNPFVKAVTNKDYLKLYKLCKREVNKHYFKRILKTFIIKTFNN